jgi:hypothetical protein
MAYQLAQVNIARLLAPIDSEQLADFVEALDSVNASAEGAPGFIWRLKTEEGNATSVEGFEWDLHGSAGIIINMSVWDSVQSLSDWVFGPFHRAVLVQRRKWFERVSEATTALWWVTQGHQPTVLDAESRVLHLRQHGPTPTAFTFKEGFAPPTT